MKNEQDELERRLSTDRFAIQKGYEEKIKIAKTKCVFEPKLLSIFLDVLLRAAMIGMVLSKHEAEVCVIHVPQINFEKRTGIAEDS
jgi:hypothetical protein